MYRLVGLLSNRCIINRVKSLTSRETDVIGAVYIATTHRIIYLTYLSTAKRVHIYNIPVHIR